MYARADGIVDFDKRICIGCKACIAACPYDAIFINPEDHAAEKCNFCAHRIDIGLEPACVVVCPTEAIIVGDLNDPTSKVAQIVGREAVAVRRPEKETFPKLFYKGAHQATLDPIAARRPEGGLFMWSEQGRGVDQVTSGHPGRNNSSAAAVLAYDVPHRAPWDWRVSLYTWTKGIAVGVYLVPLLLVLLGVLHTTSPLWTWVAPVAAGVSLALTGLLLIADLDHPKRFYLIFTRPQWKSWLVRGAFVIGAYAGVLALHFVTNFFAGGAMAQTLLMIVGLPLRRHDCGIHRLPLRPVNGARSLAEPPAPAASDGTGAPGGLCGVTRMCGVGRASNALAAGVDPCRVEFASSSLRTWRGHPCPSDRARQARR